VAKILVADDNSNVQKTVALALAELGVEVASVNNGEAAVRKLPSFLPDLVLADIFMPVRNGYEVCEFVKNDPRFSHMPVVLLVGAFDPLDEREAQRVGADGILKKPFVPPEPLITMVKTLLDRAGERLVAVAVTPHVPAAKVTTEQNAAAPVSAPAPEIPEELSIEEFPATPGRIQFADGDRPVAFGSLLETATEDVAVTKPSAIEPIEPPLEPIDNELVLTSARDANLGDPIFWRNDSGEPEAEPEPQFSEDASAAIPSTELATDLGQAWKKSEIQTPSHEDTSLLQPVETLELVIEEQVETLPTVASGSILVDVAAQSDLSVESQKPEDLAANPLEWMATAPPQIADSAPDPAPVSDDAIPVAADTIDHAEASEPSEPVAEALSESKAEVAVVASPQVSEETPQEIAAQGPVLIQVAEETAVPVADKIPAVAAAQAALPEPPADVPKKPEIAVTVADQSSTDTARSIPKEDWAALTASLGLQPTEEASSQHKAESSHTAKAPATPPASSAPATGSNGLSGSPDPALVEAVVQRVLDKMRPQVVDIITKEFLRPIVQALVHREIDKH
jgi:CheY-like chemotaxis protein